MDFFRHGSVFKDFAIGQSIEYTSIAGETESSSAGTQLDKGYLGGRAFKVRTASGEFCLLEALLKLSQSTALDTESCLRKSSVVWMRI